MKKVLVVVFSFVTFLGFGQTASTDDMSSNSQSLNYTQDRLVFDITADNWFHSIDGINTAWYSRGFGAYFMYDIVLGNGPVSIAPGLGISTSNIYHDGILSEDTSGTSLTPIPDFDAEGSPYKTNKISLSYVEVPLELRFRTRPNSKDNSFKIGLGAKLGLRIDAHTKTKLTVNGENKIYKEKRFADFSTVKFGPTFRIGYSSFNIVAFYSLTELFEKNRGPVDVYPFSIGISINGL